MRHHTAISLGICSLFLKWLVCNVLELYLMVQGRVTKEQIQQCKKYMLNFNRKVITSLSNIVTATKARGFHWTRK
jgi:hypothetical protein